MPPRSLIWSRNASLVGDHWITKELELGHPCNVSRAVNVFRNANKRKIKNLKCQLHVCKE